MSYKCNVVCRQIFGSKLNSIKVGQSLRVALSFRQGTLATFKRSTVCTTAKLYIFSWQDAKLEINIRNNSISVNNNGLEILLSDVCVTRYRSVKHTTVYHIILLCCSKFLLRAILSE